MLKGGVAAGEEATEVAVDAAVRLGPVLDEDRVVPNW